MALGRFLEVQRLIKQGSLLLPDYNELGGQPAFDSYVVPWLRTAGQITEKAIEAIRENLFLSFGSGVISAAKASHAYGQLLDALGKHRVNLNRVVLSTTNYDRAIEIGLEQLDRAGDDGFRPPSPQQAPILNPAGMIDRSYDQEVIPVLHLHGAVNWYVKQDGSVLKQYDDTPYHVSNGTPALLLPDPDKDPASDTLIGQLWAEFQGALAEASHILIIGHGLNDRALVRTLRERDRPIGWAVPNASKNSKRLQELLPSATPIDMTFGRRAVSEGLSEWLENVVPK